MENFTKGGNTVFCRLTIESVIIEWMVYNFLTNNLAYKMLGPNVQVILKKYEVHHLYVIALVCTEGTREGFVNGEVWNFEASSYISAPEMCIIAEIPAAFNNIFNKIYQ